MNHDSLSHSPVGLSLAIGGGIVAQSAPTSTVGMAGLIASLSGLLLAGFQYYKVWMDSRQRDTRIEEQAGEIARLNRDAAESTEKRHEIRNALYTATLKVAWLEGQLGITDKTHTEAINAISDDVATIAGSMRPPVRVHPQHLDPLLDSGDHPIVPPAPPHGPPNA